MQHQQQFKSVLVTGGAGFIGSHVAVALLEAGVRVTVVDELNDYYDVTIKHDNVKLLGNTATKHAVQFKFIRGDICDRDLMMRTLRDEQVDCVIHLAARAGVRASIEQPDVYVHSNLLGSTVIFDLVRQLQGQVKHVLYASSSSVYGGNKKVPFSESDQLLRVVSPYAATKMGTEALAMSYAHLSQVKFTGLRFFTVYGPRGRPDMAPFKFVDLISRGKPIDQYGDGLSSRDYTYVSDIVAGIIGSMLRPLKINNQDELHAVYNLGNSAPVTLKEFIRLCELAAGKQAMVRRLPMQPGDVERTYADISKAQRDFGYQPRVSLEAGLRQVGEWWREKYSHSNADADAESEDSAFHDFDC